ncbi:activating transcription factor 7-interacting protein 1 [Trichonephila clavata]|uniref:Activating transcription factor 7-interacting protein 1 n=1 Tax=Trichonephila clavata TaxID=2740835 RepID=A0A8X6H4V3_TRICU|nr:activating transcription factor 7-interacting protein 1 [Trichonephila clavata]
MPSNIPANTYGRLFSFEIYGYQDQNQVPFSKKLWQKVGEVKAMDLPMACTLTQLNDGRKYYFTMRAMDIFKRFGSFSDPVSIIFNKTMA